MFWGRRKRLEAEAKEALAAKIQSGIDLSIARKVKKEATGQADVLRKINHENHFSENLQKSFRSNPV